MKHHPLLFSFLAGGAMALLTVTACQKKGTTPRPQTAGQDQQGPSDPNHWVNLDGQERVDYMKEKVMPVMADLFEDKAPDDYEDPTCTLCHGERAIDGIFEMPNDALPKLSEAEMQEHPEMTAFMKTEVVPTMARLLNLPPYDPETGVGFGCYNCHVAEE